MKHVVTAVATARKMVGVLAVTVCLAGFLGWWAAKYHFEWKQRAAADREQTAIEEARKRFAEECFEAVRNADEVDVVDGVESVQPPNFERTITRFSDPVWCAKLADALSRGTYERGAHMIVSSYPQLRFYRKKTEVLNLQIKGRFELSTSSWFYSVLVVDLETTEAIRALLSQKSI